MWTESGQWWYRCCCQLIDFSNKKCTYILLIQEGHCHGASPRKYTQLCGMRWVLPIRFMMLCAGEKTQIVSNLCLALFRMKPWCFLLRCLWKRREVVLEQTVIQAWQDLYFTPLPMDASHQPIEDQSQTPPTWNVPPPMEVLPPPALHCVHSSEVPWPLGPNL